MLLSLSIELADRHFWSLCMPMLHVSGLAGHSLTHKPCFLHWDENLWSEAASKLSKNSAWCKDIWSKNIRWLYSKYQHRADWYGITETWVSSSKPANRSDPDTRSMACSFLLCVKAITSVWRTSCYPRCISEQKNAHKTFQASSQAADWIRLSPPQLKPRTIFTASPAPLCHLKHGLTEHWHYTYNLSILFLEKKVWLAEDTCFDVDLKPMKHLQAILCTLILAIR